MMIQHCRERGHKLVLVDSNEMLGNLPDEPFIEKVAAKFPEEAGPLLERHSGSFDTILSYSVLHYIFAETNLFDFLDASLSLLAHGGELLLGDIPNVSKRKRFFGSPAGVQFHQRFLGTDDRPDVQFNQIETGKIDDSVLLSLLLRARLAGCDAYLLPQPPDLPMANRREDILITKP
jgi:SAM-dependent methyltransferase